MSTVYGYARCSTDITRQDIDRQKRELRRLGVADNSHIYWEYESGTKDDRAELQKLLNVVQPGDTIACTEVSRLTRSTQRLCELLQLVQDRHLRLDIGGAFSVDCRTEDIDPMTKGMLMMWGVFAEMERDIISQRVKSGLVNARAKGKTLGRPRVSEETVPGSFWRYYSRYKGGELTVTELARLLECSRTTVYKYIRLTEENGKGRERP